MFNKGDFKIKLFFATTLFSFIYNFNVCAQIHYLNVSSGYGLSFSSQNLGSNITYGINETSNSLVNGSLGKGLITDVELGHFLNNIIAVELGISYLNGHKYSFKNSSTNNFLNELNVNSKMIRLSPKLKFSYCSKKTSYYLKFGVLFKLFGRITIRNNQKDIINNINIETERVFSKGSSFGLTSSLGMIRKLNSFTSLVLEIENINQSWGPRKDVVAEYSVDGVDMKSNLTPYQKQTNYYKKFEVENSNPSKSFYARKQLIQYFQFSSLGFKIGIQINLKKN